MYIHGGDGGGPLIIYQRLYFAQVNIQKQKYKLHHFLNVIISIAQLKLEKIKAQKSLFLPHY